MSLNSAVVYEGMPIAFELSAQPDDHGNVVCIIAVAGFTKRIVLKPIAACDIACVLNDAARRAAHRG